MTDYVKTTDFAAKDALASGNPNKLILGTQIDTEFDNIETAIATKMDSTDNIPAAQLPAATTSAQGAVELATSAETYTGTDTGRAITPDGLMDTLFAITVNADATSPTILSASAGASGWSLTRHSEGSYTITHSLGLSSSSLVLALTVTDSTAHTVCQVTTRGTNSFTVSIRAVDTSTQVDRDFSVLAVRVGA
jgi:hypothetical protein